jgi:protein-S-isoprenylcysteine O-methyltransferase Ste14
MGPVTLGLALAGWCFLHSLFATDRMKRRLYPRLQPRTYRLLYNVFSVVSLMPVGLLYVGQDGGFVIRYGFFRWVVMLVFAACVALFLWAFRLFDGPGFMGLREEKEGLFTTGAYRFCRHPMYTATLGLIWARDLRENDLVVNGVFSVYLILGAYIEERRLLHKYGNAYQAYARKTPMFLPVPRFLRRAGGPGMCFLLLACSPLLLFPC